MLHKYFDLSAGTQLLLILILSLIPTLLMNLIFLIVNDWIPDTKEYFVSLMARIQLNTAAYFTPKCSK